MTSLVPVQGNPFAAQPALTGSRLVPVQGNPFASAPSAPQPNVAQDLWNSLGTGLVKGIASLPAIPGSTLDLLATSSRWAQDRLGNVPVDKRTNPNEFQNNPLTAWLPRQQDVENALTNVTGRQFYQPQTTPGRYAETVGEFIPQAAVGGGIAGGTKGAVTAAMKYGVGGGVLSEGGGDVAATAGGESMRPVGQVIGALAAGPVTSAAKHIVTPFPADEANAARTAAAKTLTNAGVDLTTGQKTGSTALRYAESEVGGGQIEAKYAAQEKQFTKAALAKAGVFNADRATPDVISNAFDMSGKRFDALAAKNTIVADPKLQQDVTGAVDEYYRHVSQPNQKPLVAGYLQEIGTAIGSNNHTIPGDVYQSLHSRIGRDIRQTVDPDAKQALIDLNSALDDAMTRSIKANNPNDLGQWQSARQQYKNLLILQQAASANGAAASAGIITPAQLAMATKNIAGRANYARGKTDFDELARAGQVALTAPPNSGTARRTAARIGTYLPMAVGATAGTALSHGAGIPDVAGTVLGTVGGAIAGDMARGATQRVFFSPLMQRYLSNQIFAAPSPVSGIAGPAIAASQATLPSRIPRNSGPPYFLPYGVQ